MSSVVTGNLIHLASQGEFDLITHGCNCHHTMGSGIALQIKETYPQAYEADLLTKKSDITKLGDISYATVFNLSSLTEITIVNSYTQYNYLPRNVRNLDYTAVKYCFRKIKENFIHDKFTTIGYPKIGSDLAGGDWNKIYEIIKKELDGLDHVLVEYDGT